MHSSVAINRAWCCRLLVSAQNDISRHMEHFCQWAERACYVKRQQEVIQRSPCECHDDSRQIRVFLQEEGSIHSTCSICNWLYSEARQPKSNHCWQQTVLFQSLFSAHSRVACLILLEKVSSAIMLQVTIPV